MRRVGVGRREAGRRRQARRVRQRAAADGPEPVLRKGVGGVGNTHTHTHTHSHKTHTHTHTHTHTQPTDQGQSCAKATGRAGGRSERRGGGRSLLPRKGGERGSGRKIRKGRGSEGDGHGGTRA